MSATSLDRRQVLKMMGALVGGELVLASVGASPASASPADGYHRDWIVVGSVMAVKADLNQIALRSAVPSEGLIEVVCSSSTVFLRDKPVALTGFLTGDKIAVFGTREGESRFAATDVQPVYEAMFVDVEWPLPAHATTVTTERGDLLIPEDVLKIFATDPPIVSGLARVHATVRDEPAMNRYVAALIGSGGHQE